MLPAVATLRRTSFEMVLYTVLTVASATAFGFMAGMGAVYHATSAVLGLVFLAMVVRLHRTHDAGGAMRVFSYSITYLTVLFLVMVVDVLVVHGA
jgi:heme o synthase